MDETLEQFVENVSGKSRLRVEQDLGDGFVRLQTSEAERRQAIQDIRNSENIVLELLRNSRDAHARNIYLALSHEADTRTIIVIDDGDGIPEAMHEKVFEPRVTSKLNTSHIDPWGYHGRGMALYSISVNASNATVMSSSKGKGCAIEVKTNLNELGEKKDQSSFPTFSLDDNGIVHVTGPKNMQRVACEFAIEARSDCNVYIGSPTEIAATLYDFGVSALSPTERAFTKDVSQLALTKRLATSSDPSEFASTASSLGLFMSERSARRVMNGEIEPVDSLLDRIVIKSEPLSKPNQRENDTAKLRKPRQIKIAPSDREQIRTFMQKAFESIAEKYYLESDVEPHVSVSNNSLHISIPLVPEEG